jgi:hypothetical protein
MDLSRVGRPIAAALSEAQAAFRRYDGLTGVLVIREVDGQVEQLARWWR